MKRTTCLWCLNRVLKLKGDYKQAVKNNLPFFNFFVETGIEGYKTFQKVA